MKALRLFATVVFASAAGGQALRDPVFPNPIQVSTRAQLMATVEQESVRVGEPVRMHARCKNVSSMDIKVGTMNDTQDYRLIVVDSSGTELPRTAFGESWLQQQREGVLLHSQGPLPLEPGEEGPEFVLNVAKVYQLTRPGTYFARLILRLIWPDPGERRPTTVKEAQKLPVEQVVSKMIRFTITP